MRSERLLDGLGYVDAALIDEAEDTLLPSRIHWGRWGALAACAVLVLGGGLWLGQRATVCPPPPDQPPVLVMDENSFIGGDFGFEGYMARDASELVNNNPWRVGAALSTLPVFENPGRADIVEMERVLYEVADQLGIGREAVTVHVSPDEAEIQKIKDKFAATGETPTPENLAADSVSCQASGMEIMVRPDLSTRVTFDPAREWPEDFSALLGMQSPVENIYGGDYTYEGEQSFDTSYYEGGGSLTEQMLHYAYDLARVYPDEEGKLDLMWLEGVDLSHKLGDYPIISLEEATALLNDGKYLTTVFAEMRGGAYVKKAELIYRGGRDAYYMPYYRFLVEVEPEDYAPLDHGLKTYGAYYVPAVRGDYLAGLDELVLTFN